VRERGPEKQDRCRFSAPIASRREGGIDSVAGNVRAVSFGVSSRVDFRQRREFLGSKVASAFRDIRKEKSPTAEGRFA